MYDSIPWKQSANNNHAITSNHEMELSNSSQMGTAVVDDSFNSFKTFAQFK